MRAVAQLAEIDTVDVFLIVYGVFFAALWLAALVLIVIDVIRDPALSGGWKALWIFLAIFFPIVTAFVYLALRGEGMHERARAVHGGRRESPADELIKLEGLRDRGTISAGEFDRLKNRVLAEAR